LLLVKICNFSPVRHPYDLSGRGEGSMSKDTSANTPSRNGASLSLDVWAVIVALALALAVRFDILKNVPW
jgi:hypothetical protein